MVLLIAGAVAGGIAVLAKWLVVGRIRAVEHPLWSSFVWRNEVSDTFVETVAGPWFARAASGTPVMNLWLRALGAKIGRGVWCETYWLPEADLVTLAEGSTVNRGCVVQTHLFHDRIMRMDTVVLEEGSTLGTHCVALPAAKLGAGATVGPASLVMRGDEVPANTRWQGNPIAPWTVSRKKRAGKSDTSECRGHCRVSKPKKDKPGHRSSTRTFRTTATSGIGCRATNSALEYKVAINRLDRVGDHHRGHAGRAADVHPRPVRRTVGGEGDGQRPTGRHHFAAPAASCTSPWAPRCRRERP